MRNTRSLEGNLSWKIDERLLLLYEVSEVYAGGERMVSEFLVGLLMGLFSLTGFIVNWLIVVLMWKVTKLQNPFALLSVGLAAVDGMFSTLYLCYATPMVLFDIVALQDGSSICGYLLMICYNSAFSIHFVISVNRFLAVFQPLHYHRIFNSTFTKYILLLIFAISFSLVTIFFQFLGCENYYNRELRAFRYSDQPICKAYGQYADFYQILSLTVISALLDLFTIRKVWKIRGSSQRSVKEVNLLKQSVSQTSFVLFIVLVLTIAPRIITSTEFAFIFSSLLWLSLHSFDGYQLSRQHVAHVKVQGVHLDFQHGHA